MFCVLCDSKCSPCSVCCVIRSVNRVLCLVWFKMFTMFCELCDQKCSPCSLYCVIQTVHQSVHHVLCIVWSKVFTMFCVLCDSKCSSCSVYYVIQSVHQSAHHVLCMVWSKVFTMFCVLCDSQPATVAARARAYRPEGTGPTAPPHTVSMAGPTEATPQWTGITPALDRWEIWVSPLPCLGPLFNHSLPAFPYYLSAMAG